MVKRIYYGGVPKNGSGSSKSDNDDSEDDTEQCAINKDNQKVTKVNNHIYYYNRKFFTKTWHLFFIN